MDKTVLAQSIAALKSYCASPEKGGACTLDNRSCCWMKHDHYAVKPIASNEQISLRALVAYVSFKTGKTEFRVERDLSDNFCIPNIKCLPAEHYDNAIRYLSEQVTFPFSAQAS